jgi:hypothetical protein
MRRCSDLRSSAFICGQLSLCLALMVCRAEILDRIAVTVGKYVITESDVLRELRIEAFLDRKPPSFSGEDKRKAADRIVDQHLVLQEAATSHLTLASVPEAQELVEQLKAQFPGKAEYQSALTKYQITGQELEDHMLAGLRTSRLTDLRFRPEVQIRDEELRDYYNTRVAEWRKANAAEIPTYEASHDQLEKLLTEERVMQALDRWLGTARNDTQILYREPVFK